MVKIKAMATDLEMGWEFRK